MSLSGADLLEELIKKTEGGIEDLDEFFEVMLKHPGLCPKHRAEILQMQEQIRETKKKLEVPKDDSSPPTDEGA